MHEPAERRPPALRDSDERRGQAVEWARQLSVHLTEGRHSVGTCLAFTLFQRFVASGRQYYNPAVPVQPELIFRQLLELASEIVDDELLIEACFALHEQRRDSQYMTGPYELRQVLDRARYPLIELKEVQDRIKAHNRYLRKKAEKAAAARPKIILCRPTETGSERAAREAAAARVVLRRPT
jgi:hypothetical protein